MHDEPGILGEEGRRRIMMTMTLRIALVLVSLGTFSLMMRKIRQSKLQIESAIFWIVFSIVLVVFSIFPSVADFASRLLGIYATTNFLFLFAIFLLIVKRQRSYGDVREKRKKGKRSSRSCNKTRRRK